MGINKEIDNLEKCTRHLEFAKIRCQELMIAIDYELLNYGRMLLEDIKLDGIKISLETLCDDIQAAEDS